MPKKKKAELAEAATAHFHRQVGAHREFIAANAHLAGHNPLQPWNGNGLLRFYQAIIYTAIESDPVIHFSDPDCDLVFKGHAWGPAIGGGEAAMMGAFAVPGPSMIGDVQFNFNTIGAQSVITFLRGPQYLGSMVGIGLALGTGLTVGSGTFAKA